MKTVPEPWRPTRTASSPKWGWYAATFAILPVRQQPDDFSARPILQPRGHRRHFYRMARARVALSWSRTLSYAAT